MATGSGTGTPATGAGAATLSSIRARIMQQVTNASSGVDHAVVARSSLTLVQLRDRVEVTLQASGKSYPTASEPMTASALTLTTLRDRVEVALQDSGNLIWAEADIEEAVRQTIEQYSRVKPDRAIHDLTLAATGREISISGISGLIRVEKVWCPYVSATPSYPPNWRHFEIWPGSILYVDDADEPQNTEHVRIFYTKEHLLSGLDAAASTTLPVDDESFIINGAAAFAARFRAIEIAETANVDSQVFTRLQNWANKAMSEFNEGLRLRERVRATKYDQDAIDEAIRQTMEQYSRHKPDHAIHDLTLSADGREVDISGISGLIRVERIWWDYDSTTPGHPPTWRHFITWPGSIVYVDDADIPASGDHVRVWYTKEHTINGLDSAAATTIPVDDEAFIVAGAAAFAARFQAAASSGTPSSLMEWAKVTMAEFTRGLRIRDWKRYTFSYDQDDVDEAIRWALHRYSEIHPDQTITALTLSASGREVDISSITDYVQVQRVWWDYESADPSYPPDYRDFELWSGDLLFVKDGNEPQSGDVVRVWYTRLRALNGLDSASTTTLPDEDETLIVVGASGYVAQERVQDEPRRYVPRKLREWADARLKEFEAGLKRLARRNAARHSGIAQMPALDRWDNGSGWS